MDALTAVNDRHDGFDGPIAVELRGLPDGLVATTGTILPGESTVALTVEASPAAGHLHAPLQAAGTARIDGRPVTHVARLRVRRVLKMSDRRRRNR